MKSISASILLALFSVISMTLVPRSSAFAPATPRITSARVLAGSAPSKTQVYINIGEKEREALTRDSEPEDFFRTNTDKMSDKEKLPIAIAGVAFITIPFLAGLIALYAAK